jgi:hypothetical protein
LNQNLSDFVQDSSDDRPTGRHGGYFPIAANRLLAYRSSGLAAAGQCLPFGEASAALYFNAAAGRLGGVY